MVLCLFSRLMVFFFWSLPILYSFSLVLRLGYHHETLQRHSRRFEDSQVTGVENMI